MKLYYGWYMVGFTIIANMFVIGIPYLSFGIFVVPVAEDLGLSRAEVNTALILLNLGTALTATVIGRLMDIWSLRSIFVASSLAVGACFAAIAFSPSIWLIAFVLFVPLPVALQGAATMSTNVLLLRWFEAQRGRALALGLMGISLGGILMPPLVGWLVDALGWRMGVMALGAILVAALFPLSLAVRDRPGPLDVEVRGSAAVKPAVKPSASAAEAGSAGKPASFMEILRMPAFWTIGVSAAISITISTSLGISMVPITLETGVTAVQAAIVLSVMGAGGVCGRLLIAAFGDKFDRMTLLTGVYGLNSILLAALLMGHGYESLMVLAFVIGTVGAGKMPLYYALIGDHLGTASFGTAQGLLAVIGAVMGAIGYRFAGEVFDRTGTYDLMLITFAGLQVVAAVLLFATRLINNPKPLMSRERVST